MVASILRISPIIGIRQKLGGHTVMVQIKLENVDQKHRNCQMVVSPVVIRIQRINAALKMDTAAPDLIFAKNNRGVNDHKR